MFDGFLHQKIAVLGSGPEALASAICLARHQWVSLGEEVGHRQTSLAAGLDMYPNEPELDDLARQVSARLALVGSYRDALQDVDLAIVAEPPRFIAAQARFDMSGIEHCLQVVAKYRPHIPVVLETHTPVGYAVSAALRHGIQILPAPLHRRRGRIARDRACLDRVVVGDNSTRGLTYAFLIVRSCTTLNTPFFLANPSEVEAIHAFELRREASGRVEPVDVVAAYCLRHRLNADQVLGGLSPIDYVYESPAVALCA